MSSSIRNEQPAVSVRLVTADYYMSHPISELDPRYSHYRGLEIKKVPVIRVFGSTSKGHKVCLHVHGVFPYLYVPYDGSSPSDRMGRQIVMDLDKAVNILQGQGTSDAHHVFKAVLVSGVPMYGYHRKEHQFFKLYFYNPITRKHSYDLLLNGAVMNKVLQPCEAHIPYVLQFMMDFNLQGMNFIHLKSASARRSPGGLNDLLLPGQAEPVSSCELELDCFAGDILNSLEVQDGVQMNPGLAALWEEELERRKVKKMNLESIHPPASQPRTDVSPTASHLFFQKLLEERCTEDTDNISMSFMEVNEQLETSLAIETPEDAAKELMSASSLDLHAAKEITPSSISTDGELLDILCELAEEHGESAASRESITSGSQLSNSTSRWTVTTPLLEFPSGEESLEDLPFDADSVLGTQHPCAQEELTNGQEDIGDSGEEDEDRETLEMSQIFSLDDHLLDTRTPMEEEEQTLSGPDSSSSTILPNLDGADDGSSDENEASSSSRHHRKSIQKYKPLNFRSSSTTRTSNATDGSISSPSIIPHSSPPRATQLTNVSSGNAENEELYGYADALYTMSYLSPQPEAARHSPPRPTTPIKTAQVLVRPLLNDLATFEASSGRKVVVSPSRVTLKDLGEEIRSYQTRSRRKLRLPADLCRGKQAKKTLLSSATQPSEKKKITSSQNIECKEIPVIDGTEEIGKNRAAPAVETSGDNQPTSSPSMIPPSLTDREESDPHPSSSLCLTHSDNIQTNDVDFKTNLVTSRVTGEIEISERENNEANEVQALKTNATAELIVAEDMVITDSEGEQPPTYGSGFSPLVIKEGNDLSDVSLPHPQTQDFLKNKVPRSSSRLASSDHSSSLVTWDEDSKMEASQKPPIARIFRHGLVYTSDDAPRVQHVTSTMEFYDIPSTDNGAPFWGNPKDYVKPKELRDKLVGIKLVRSLPEWGSNSFEASGEKGAMLPTVLTPLCDPPSRRSVAQWLDEGNAPESLKKRDLKDRSQLEAASLNNTFGFRASFGNCLEAKAVHQYQYLTVMSCELHLSSREHLRPDPEFDPVLALFYSITHDAPPVSTSGPLFVTGVIVIGEKDLLNKSGVVLEDLHVELVPDELSLFRRLSLLVADWNPDLLVGYEIEMLSWGYLLQRGKKMGWPVHDWLSRIPNGRPERTALPESGDIIEGGYIVEKNSDIAVPGRIVLNLWRLLRVEIAVQSYTYENMAFHLLHRRVPLFPFHQLSSWWNNHLERWIVVEHYMSRVRGNLELMEKLDLIGRTSELARLFGIQFYEVFTRGSQYRVESMMLRLAKPKNFVAASPSVTQRSRMKAPEWLPLILEPESKFYTDPVLVLDFQSLYPSMIIAYNYCYSTCLGRTHLLGRNEPFDFGCTQLLIPPEVVQDLVKQDLVNISPAGVVFVKPHVRRGIIPQMLDEILSTRLMVKQSMKEYEGDSTLRRVFESRQLGLKLIANVTYGYTSANFSGRMPCVEVGDSVVSKGRETLERAIHLIEEKTEWKARVVYGDTDSVFVLLPGRSKQEAFSIGAEIADAVTRTNPSPVKLKFEKVYQPCILQTKKRYVGYKYETPSQKDAVYEAKGIETVRRDGCPAVVKMLEKSLRVLFETHDVSKVKAYAERQFTKILQNRSSWQDFIFAKEFRGRQGYKPGACVPALEIAKQQARTDSRSEARIGERVPYVVVYGSPGVPLIRLVVPAEQFLRDFSLRLNAHYYITRAIVPALQRCLGLLGVDVLSWYQHLPRLSAAPLGSVEPVVQATISRYFRSSTCLLCDEPAAPSDSLCNDCRSNRQASSFALAAMQSMREKEHAGITNICRSCTGSVNAGLHCISMDCPVLYRRVKTTNNLQLTLHWRDVLSTL